MKNSRFKYDLITISIVKMDFVSLFLSFDYSVPLG